MKLVGYVCSRDGLPERKEQEAAVKSWCATNGHELVGEFFHDKGNSEVNQLKQAIMQADSHDGLVVYSGDASLRHLWSQLKPADQKAILEKFIRQHEQKMFHAVEGDLTKSHLDDLWTLSFNAHQAQIIQQHRN